jgi:hypothetical protein
MDNANDKSKSIGSLSKKKNCLNGIVKYCVAERTTTLKGSAKAVFA